MKIRCDTSPNDTLVMEDVTKARLSIPHGMSVVLGEAKAVKVATWLFNLYGYEVEVQE